MGSGVVQGTILNFARLSNDLRVKWGLQDELQDRMWLNSC